MDVIMQKTIINPVKITVELPKEILRKLVDEKLLQEYISCSTSLTIRDYRSLEIFNETVAVMIVERWM